MKEAGRQTIGCDNFDRYLNFALIKLILEISLDNMLKSAKFEFYKGDW